MTPIYLLSAVLLAAMFLGADGNDAAAGSLSLQDLEARCQKNLGLDLIPHPGECQLYYNCSHQQQQQQNHFTKYLQECPYPQLFSVATFRCQQFDEVACGHRLELVDKCDYLSHRHNNRGHSIPCYVNSPSCNWLPDGANVYQHRLWSPYYAICRSQRTVATGSCPTHKALEMTQLLHPKKRRCVSLYEIPKNHSGYEMTCTGKTDGLYMDDVTSRPDVHYSCLCGQLASVQRCPKGQYFDEWLATCSDSPLRNRITMAGKHVHIKNPENVARIIRQMMEDAHHKLQVVADFDRTLSKYAHKGQTCSTTHGVLEDSQFMSEDFKKKATALKEHYLPIEFDGGRSIQEKIPYMIEWWTNGHALITSTDLTRDLLRTIVRSSTAHLRDGCQWFFDELHEHKIPLLIFSAGLGDIITELITFQQGHVYDNMKIVSNFLKFDEGGKMTGFQNDLVHVYNKNENAVHSSDYFEKIKHRQNLILLGDSLGDLRMAEGAGDLECMLKIGFLNFKVEENLEQYRDSYDIVIIQDETMDVVNSLMRKILGHS